MIKVLSCLLATLLLISACDAETRGPESPAVPRGYYAQLEIVHEGRQLDFGPFVGYYFKPLDGDNLTNLEFICFNERRFYTDEQPVNAKLFAGDAVLVTLPAGDPIPERRQRINPVFFDQAPLAWLQSRPEPQDAFVHFHSAYDRSGAVLTGYWLRHRPLRAFTYNMGGRVVQSSPLYHRAEPGNTESFPHIIEFDYGPANE